MKKVSSSKKTTNKKQVSKRSTALAAFQTGADLRAALLVVSLLANLFVLCVWILLHITSQYDKALFDFFVNR